MKKLSSVASVLALSIGVAVAPAAAASAATDRSGAERLNIPNNSACKAGRTVMQGMVAGPGGQLYIVFTKAAGAEPVLSRWSRDGSTWDGASWTCSGAPVSMPTLEHGNDLAYNPDYLGQGPALIATQGSQSSFLSDDVTIVHLSSSGAIGAAEEVDLPMNISGLCYSATAADGAGKYAARRLGSLWTHSSSGSLSSGWTLADSSLTSHDNRSDQGIDCSANYIWNTKSINDSTPETGWNWVYQYNWSGGDVEGDIGIPSNSLVDEIEDITHVGSDFFVGINRNDGLADTVKVFTE
ncbi:hypothetical protein [Actinoplanes regularis]|uniref:Secreted protein n=1 Tax=Actinoplanes regularis TaxID=52697 RepID=A0A239B045_9ACTN|nr:hypothetical protein [Actinoplanes regularis]GIE87257.1 hypothetical protein Are01nite_37370 [Actinoplanes regularis]SNS00942.1 hypothetical protein SAMN06264365_108228 [Actinoplanes regularis]